MKTIKMQKKNEYLLAGILSFSFLFLFFIGTGILFSGLHLVDDHECFTFAAILEEKGFFEGFAQIFIHDFTKRFRPLYMIIRILKVHFFGINMVAWYICNAAEIALALLFFYIFAREMKTNVFFSVMFALVILVGGQSAVWWRLGPPESLATMLFGAALLATLYLSKKRTKKSVAIFIIFLTLMSLQKEAFLISVPGFYLLLMAFEVRNEENQVNLKEIIITFFKKHIFEIVVMVIVVLIEAYVTVFVVGTNQIGYAGFSSDWGLKDYLAGIWNNLRHSCFSYMVLSVLMFIAILTCLRKYVITWAEVLELLFCIYIFVAQQFLHAKSEMFERYFLPWVICICYFAMIMCYRFIQGNKKVVIVAGGVLLLFGAYYFDEAVTIGVRFADRGAQLKECMEYVADNCEKDVKIVSTIGVHEEDMSVGIFLEELYGYSDISNICLVEDRIEEWKSADVLFARGEQIYDYLSQVDDLSLDDFELFAMEHYEVAIRKNVK